MASRCRDYLYDGSAAADIVICAERYCPERYPDGISPELLAYMESGRQFHTRLLHFNGLYLHASAVEVDGRAYLFSGPSGTGKSTHTRLWQQLPGLSACVFNDDKPALRCLDGVWYAYGTPWCGKDGINVNMKVPVAGICFLKQAGHNRIRELSPIEAIPKLLSQTIHVFRESERLNLLLDHLDHLVSAIPIYELENKPELEAVRLSYETMLVGMKENIQ